MKNFLSTRFIVPEASSVYPVTGNYGIYMRNTLLLIPPAPRR
jgi:hypothetical protein